MDLILFCASSLLFLSQGASSVHLIHVRRLLRVGNKVKNEVDTLLIQG